MHETSCSAERRIGDWDSERLLSSSSVTSASGDSRSFSATFADMDSETD